jgi:hypothetical protein
MTRAQKKTNNKISPEEFLTRYQARDPEMLALWDGYTLNLRQIRQEARCYLTDHFKALARFQDDEHDHDHDWFLFAGVDAMDETDPAVIAAILQRSYDLYYLADGEDADEQETGQSLTHDIPVEWDALAAASANCLVTPRKDLQKEVVSELAASVTWHLWQRDLGDFGTFEVRKLRAGWSQIYFSGFGAVSGEQREAKQRYMQQIISAYYQRLMKENIWDIQEQPVVLEAQALTESQPWLHIPDKRNQRRIVELWCKGKSAKEIAKEIGVNPQYVYNLLLKLRRQYPEARIPIR